MGFVPLKDASSPALVNLFETHQKIDGFGASTAFAIPYSTSVANFLWSPTLGIGLSLARAWINENGYPRTLTTTGADATGSNWAMDSTGQNANDVNYLVQAQVSAYGVGMWGTVWSFPTAWTGGSANGTLDVSHYGDAATLMVNYCDRAWALGVPIIAVGPCNEPDFTPSYPQTAWTSAQIIAFIKNNLASALATWGAANPTWQAATGLSAPRIVVPDVATWSNLPAWINSIEADSTALADTGIYGVHQYGGGGASAPPTPTSRPIWENECTTQTSFDAGMTNAIATMTLVHNALTTGNACAWHYWFAEDVSDTDNGGLVGTNSSNWTNPAASLADWNAPTFRKCAYAFGQYSKFVRPGWRRVGISNAPGGALMTAFRNPATSQLAIVGINSTGSDIPITCAVNGINVQTITPYVTDATRSLTAQLPLSVSTNRFRSTIPANSVTTFVG
jgi:glucuronoarabinoxylan endo-1,4-beta-xylanase